MVQENSERRRFPRIHTETGLPIKISYPANETDERKVGFRMAKDISKGGLRFESSQAVPSQLPVSIQIALKEHARAIKREAKVCWTKENPIEACFEIGVEFIESNPRDEQLWARYVGRQLQSAS